MGGYAETIVYLGDAFTSQAEPIRAMTVFMSVCHAREFPPLYKRTIAGDRIIYVFRTKEGVLRGSILIIQSKPQLRLSTTSIRIAQDAENNCI